MIPSGQTLLDVLLVVGFLGSIAASLMSVRSNQRIQKREVVMTTENATRIELQAISDRVDKIENSIESVNTMLHQETQRILDAGEQRVKDLHNRINPIEGLKAAVEITNQRLAHLDIKIDNMNKKRG